MKRNKGITLIALVVTIIVLLILAGVTIALLTGDNGIITQANKAKENTEIGEEKEKIQLALTDYEMKKNEENKYNLIEKETGQKILNREEENALNGEIIELENGRKYLITKDKVEYINNIENAILMQGRTFSQGEDWSKLVGQTIYSREQVESVYILNNKNIPDNEIYSWDISQNQDKSVMSWVMDDDKNGLYEWYIGANYRIKANENMSYYFSDLTNCIKIEGLEYLDLLNTKNIDNLFLLSSKITQLDLSSWNTTNITRMTSVFSHCTNLEKVNVSSWDTSKVTIMSEMFYWCKNLKELDLTNFNTEQVTSMQSMFGYCNKLEKIELDSFDTSNVINMMGMFRDVLNLTELKLSNFNTEKVENFNSMFFGSYKLQKLDISNFKINDGADYKNFLNNVPKDIKVYVKDLDIKNKLLENFSKYLAESNIIIK